MPAQFIPKEFKGFIEQADKLAAQTPISSYESVSITSTIEWPRTPMPLRRLHVPQPPILACCQNTAPILALKVSLSSSYLHLLPYPKRAAYSRPYQGCVWHSMHARTRFSLNSSVAVAIVALPQISTTRQSYSCLAFAFCFCFFLFFCCCYSRLWPGRAVANPKRKRRRCAKQVKFSRPTLISIGVNKCMTLKLISIALVNISIPLRTKLSTAPCVCNR